MKKDLIIVGAGGFGRELLQWIKDINKVEDKWNILGFIDDDIHALDNFSCSHAIIGTIKDWRPQLNCEFACAIANPEIKQNVVNVLKEKGAVFTSIIHPTAQIAETAEIGEGLVLYPRGLITVNTTIGDFVTVLSSSIGHDAVVGDYTTISSYCDITGGVQIEEKVFLGSRVTIIPKRKIGRGAYVAAGSVVMSNVRAGYHMMGNPAHKMDL